MQIPSSGEDDEEAGKLDLDHKLVEKEEDDSTHKTMPDHAPDSLEKENTEEEEEDEELAKKEFQRKCLKRLYILVAVAATILVINMVVFFPKQDNRHVDLEYMFKILPNFTLPALNVTNSSQDMAMQWLLEDPAVHAYPNAQLIQRYALATLYFSLNNDYKAEVNQTRNRNMQIQTPTNHWNQAEYWLNYTHHECLWWMSASEETCAAGLYQHLQLNNNNLHGSLPPELALLTSLKTISMKSNSIYGPLPTELGLLTALEDLSLSTNRIRRSLPTELGLLSDSLMALHLSHNDLTGSLPGHHWGNLS